MAGDYGKHPVASHQFLVRMRPASTCLRDVLLCKGTK